MEIRCVLLDIGKVLLDFDFIRFTNRLKELTGCGSDAIRMSIQANGLAARYESGAITDSDFHREFCRGLGKEVSWDDFVKAWNCIFFPDPILPEEVLPTLAEKRTLWAVSNTNKLHFDFIADNYPLMRHFTGFILSHEVGALKPDPSIFERALDRARARPDEALFVDDQAANVRAARELGIDAFQFRDPEQFSRELRMRNLL